MANPTFSIILPTFNRAPMLKLAIESVVTQTFRDFELIIINDGSGDDTQEIARPFLSDSRIHIYHQENTGKGPSRNLGLRMSTGRFVCFLDDDDTYFKDHLATFANYIEEYKTENDILRTGVRAKLSTDREFNSQPYPGGNIKDQIHFVLTRYFSLLDLCIPGNIARKYTFPDIPLWQDKFYLLEILSVHNLIQIPGITVEAGEHPLRSVNTAYKNPDLIAKQIKGVHRAGLKLKDKRLAESATLDHVIQNIYLTHIMNSLHSGGFSEGYRFTKHLIHNEPFNPRMSTVAKSWIAHYFDKLLTAFR